MSATLSAKYRRIATEEAWAPPSVIRRYQALVGTIGDPGFDSLWGFYGRSTSVRARGIFERLQNLGEQRLRDMDAAGIDTAVLSLTSPGVQCFDPDTASAIARDTNDELADACRRHPTRFAAVASFGPLQPAVAAREIERAVSTLGMKGAIVNSHTHGEYLSDPKFWEVFAACEQLGVPLYLHPQTPPPAMVAPFLDAGLDGAVFGFGVETGFHMLRIITSGVFDRFPALQVCIGHMGEALPYWLYRLDYMHGATVRSERYPCLKPLRRQVSDYLRSNVYVTSSGYAWAPAIRFAQEVLGADRVMYAMDYPYQYEPDEVRILDAMPMPDAEKKLFFQTNAERLYQLASAHSRDR